MERKLKGHFSFKNVSEIEKRVIKHTIIKHEMDYLYDKFNMLKKQLGLASVRDYGFPLDIRMIDCENEQILLCNGDFIQFNNDAKKVCKKTMTAGFKFESLKKEFDQHGEDLWLYIEEYFNLDGDSDWTLCINTRSVYNRSSERTSSDDFLGDIFS